MERLKKGYWDDSASVLAERDAALAENEWLKDQMWGFIKQQEHYEKLLNSQAHIIDARERPPASAGGGFEMLMAPERTKFAMRQFADLSKVDQEKILKLIEAIVCIHTPTK